MGKKGAMIAGAAVFVGIMGAQEVVEADRLEAAQEAEIEYTRKFGCTVLDVVFEVDHSGETINPGAEGAPLAVTTEENRVIFSRELVNLMSLARINRDAFSEVAAHELAHACGGPRKSLPDNFVNADGRFVAVEGFKVIVELNNNPGREQWFSFIEEGAASVLAEQTPGAAGFENSLKYEALKGFTEDLQQKHRISNSELAGMVNNSDLLAFVARVRGLGSASQVDINHLGGLMWEYCRAYSEAQKKANLPPDQVIKC